MNLMKDHSNVDQFAKKTNKQIKNWGEKMEESLYIFIVIPLAY